MSINVCTEFPIPSFIKVFWISCREYPRMWAANAASYCQSRAEELPKQNMTKSHERWDGKLCSKDSKYLTVTIPLENTFNIGSRRLFTHEFNFYLIKSQFYTGLFLSPCTLRPPPACCRSWASAGVPPARPPSRRTAHPSLAPSRICRMVSNCFVSFTALMQFSWPEYFLPRADWSILKTLISSISPSG